MLSQERPRVAWPRMVSSHRDDAPKGSVWGQDGWSQAQRIAEGLDLSRWAVRG